MGARPLDDPCLGLFCGRAGGQTVVTNDQWRCAPLTSMTLSDHGGLTLDGSGDRQFVVGLGLGRIVALHAPRIHFIPDSRTYSVHLFLKR